jgi:hypothetical protein
MKDLGTLGVVAGEMWESRVRCGISKRGGNGGKVGVGLFHGSHGASFPQPSSGFWAILARMPSLGTTGGSIPHFQNPRQMHIFPDSCGEPKYVELSAQRVLVLATLATRSRVLGFKVHLYLFRGWHCCVFA